MDTTGIFSGYLKSLEEEAINLVCLKLQLTHICMGWICTCKVVGMDPRVVWASQLSRCWMSSFMAGKVQRETDSDLGSYLENGSFVLRFCVLDYLIK